MFIWDADVESADKRMSIEPLTPFAWKLDTVLKEALAKNHRLAYKEVSYAYQKEDFHEKIMKKRYCPKP